jgi:hypothetical protein
MKRVGFLLAVASVLFIASAGVLRAQGRFGFGFIVGDPTGFSFKYKMNNENAIDGALGFFPSNRFRLHADYLWVARPFRDQQFTLTYGVGPAVGFGRTEVVARKGLIYYSRQEAAFGIRFPLGVSYVIPRSPVELTLELAPLVVFAPDGGFGIDGGLAIRLYP